MAIDHVGGKLYVNHFWTLVKIGVVSCKPAISRSVRYPKPRARTEPPLVSMSPNHRCSAPRTPHLILFVFDIGHCQSRCESAVPENSDDMGYDPERKRIYIVWQRSCIQAVGRGPYEKIAEITTGLRRARRLFFVPELNRL